MSDTAPTMLTREQVVARFAAAGITPETDEQQAFIDGMLTDGLAPESVVDANIRAIHDVPPGMGM